MQLTNIAGKWSISGMREFCSKYPQAKPYLVGGQGMPLEQFFTARAVDFL